jgi:hypothetical protein
MLNNLRIERHRKGRNNWAWWFMPIILVFRLLRQKDQQVEVNLYYTVRSCDKK